VTVTNTLARMTNDDLRVGDPAAVSDDLLASLGAAVLPAGR
jgi:hypothetical protein